MKKLLLFLLASVLCFSAASQTVLFYEGFNGTTSQMTSTQVVQPGTPDWHAETNIYSSLRKSVLLPQSSISTSQASLETAYISKGANPATAYYLTFKHICKLLYTSNAKVRCKIRYNDGTAESGWIDLMSSTAGVPNYYIGEGSITGSRFYQGSYSSAVYPNWENHGSTTGTDVSGTPTNSWWRYETFNLTSLMSPSNVDAILIQFTAYGTGVTTNPNAGWYLDDVQLSCSPSELVPPTIKLVATPVEYTDDIYNNTGSFRITADITDASGIIRDSVYLKYQINGGVHTELARHDTLANRFYWTIPAQVYGTKIRYDIWAADIHRNRAQLTREYVLKYDSVGVIIIGDETSTCTNQYVLNTAQQWGQSYTIYTGTELTPLYTNNGVVPGSQLKIQSIEYYLTSLPLATSAAYPYTVDIYMGTTSSSSVSGGLSFPSATLVGTATITSTDVEVGWKRFNLTTPYNYTGGNLYVYIKKHGAAVAGNTLVRCSPTTTSLFGYYESATTAGTTVTTSSVSRPVIGIRAQYRPAANDLALVSFENPSSSTMVGNQPIKIVMKNSSPNEMTSAQIGWSVNGGATQIYNWTPAAPNVPAPQDFPVSVTIGNYTFPAGESCVKAWVISRNGIPDDRTSNDTIEICTYVCTSALNSTIDGPYTLGGNGADFANFTELKNKMIKCTVSGPSVIRINPGTYDMLTLDQVYPGMSATNTVTFTSATGNAADVIIRDRSASSDGAIILSNTLGFIFDKLTIQGKTGNTATHSRGVFFTGNAVKNVTISNCIITVKDTITPNSIVGYAGISRESFPLNIFEYDQDINILNNTITGGSFGIRLAGPATAKIQRVSIKGNTITSGSRGIFTTNANVPEVSSNVVNQKSNSASATYWGIYLSNSVTPGKIEKNKINISKGMEYGIYLASSKGGATNRLMVINNEIRGTTIGTSADKYGFYIISCDSAQLINNSVMLKSDANVTIKTAPIYISGGNYITIKNNILANYCISHTNNNFAYQIGTKPGNFESNYNNLYTIGTNVGFYNSAVRATVTDWATAISADANSVSVDPHFADPTVSLEPAVYAGMECPVNTLVPNDINNNSRGSGNTYMGAYSILPPTLNIAVIQLVQPSDPATGCPSDNSPVIVKIQNGGSQTINFATNPVTIATTVTINGVPQTSNTTVNTGTLAPLATLDITVLANIAVPINSPVTCNFTATMPGDGVASDNVLNVTYTRSRIVPIYDQNFSTEPDPVWTITSSNASYKWTFESGNGSNPAITPAFGTGRMYFNSATATAGSTSRAVMPLLSLVGTHGPVLEFWFAHNNGNPTRNDSVTVKVSTDGGVTYQSLLQVQRYNSAYTTPGWKKYTVDLSAYTSYNCILIAFDATSRLGGNMNIDRVVIRSIYSNDIAVRNIYPLGHNPTGVHATQKIKARIENVGALTQTDVPVNLVITDAGNTTIHTSSQTIASIAKDEVKTITFNLTGFYPTVNGNNNVKVYVNPDDNPETDNNEQNWMMVTDPKFISHIEDSTSTITGNATSKISAAVRYKTDTIVNVASAKVFIVDPANIGKRFKAFVANPARTQLATSNIVTITAGMINTWVEVPINNYALTNLTGDIYVGIEMQEIGNYIGVQTKETPLRDSTFYLYTAANYTPYTTGKFMIGANLVPASVHDFAFLSINGLASSCGMGVDSIRITYTNYGYRNIPAGTVVNYSVNGGATQTGTITNIIAARQTYNFTFPTPFDFHNPLIGTDFNYQVKVWVNALDSDYVRNNDTIRKDVLSLAPNNPPVVTSPVNIGFMESTTLQSTPPNGQQGMIKWFTFQAPNTWTEIASGTETYTTPILLESTTYYTSFDPTIEGVIGTGTSTTSNPFMFGWGYSRGKILYLQSEIGGYGSVRSISLYVGTASPSSTLPLQIWIKQVPEDNLSTTFSTWANETAGATLVYSGPNPFTATGWHDFELPTAFNYNAGNLLILTRSTCGGTSCSSYGSSTYPAFRYTTISGKVVYSYQDNTESDPLTNSTSSTNRPNLRFLIGEPGACPSEKTPIVVNVQQIPVYDVATNRIVAPESGCGLYQENLKVNITNTKTNIIPANTVIVKANLNGTILTDTIKTSFASEETKTVTFTTPYDFTALTTDIAVNYIVWTEMTNNDPNIYRTNDTITGIITSYQTGVLAAFPNMTGEYTQPSTIQPTLGYSNYMFYESATSTDVLNVGSSYTTPDLYETTTYWVSAIGGSFEEIGTGTSGTSNPFMFGWGYSRGKILYTAEEVGGYGPITGIAINVVTPSPGNGLPIKIYLKQIPDNTLTTTTNWTTDTAAANGAKLVWDHTKNNNQNLLQLTPAGWKIMFLDEPFSFNSGNLLILTESNCGGGSCSSYSSTYPTFQYTTTSAGRVVYWYADNNPPAATSTGSTSTNRWNLRLYRGCATNRVQQTIDIAVPDYDLKTLSVIDTISNRCEIRQEHLTMVVKNTKNNTIPDSTFKAVIDFGAHGVVTQAIPSIAPNATVNVYFEDLFDFTTISGDLLYEYTAYTTEYDSPVYQIYRNNDTIHGEFLILANPNPPAPIVMNGEYGYPNTIVPSDPYLNRFYFYTQQTGGTLLGSGASFTTPPLYTTTTYWMSGSIIDPDLADLPETVEIGTGTSFDYLPLAFNWGYSRGKQMYTVEEVGGYGSITSIAFEVGTTYSSGLPVKFYLKQVPETSLTATYNWAVDTSAASGAVLVYAGNYIFSPAGWHTITLPTPFNYSSGNLVLLTEHNCGSTNCSAYGSSTYPTFKQGGNHTGKVVRFYKDTTEPESTCSGTTSTSRWNITLGISQSCKSERVPVVVNITPPSCDLAIVSIDSPISPADFSTNKPIDVTIANYGTTDINNFRVGYFFEGGEPAGEIEFNDLIAGNGGILNINLNPGVFIPVPTAGLNHLYVYVIAPCDEFSHNDTLGKELRWNNPCASNATNPANSDISQFKLSNVTNGPGLPRFNYPANTAGYSDFTQTVDPIILYKNHPDTAYITISYAGTAAAANNIRMYIDVNHDNTFDATNELFFSTSVPGASGQTPEVARGIFTIPASALSGYTRLRVVAVQGTATPAPCGTYTYGETEDYTVLILDSLPKDLGIAQLTHPSDTICADQQGRVRIQVKNFGTQTQTFSSSNKLTVSAIVSGVASGTYSTEITSGSLAPGASMAVAIPGIDFSRVGDYVVTSSISYAGDMFAGNNAASSHAYVKNTNILPTLSEDFSTGVVGGAFPDGWIISHDISDFIWNINEGRTPSYPAAGPYYDHTTRTGKYAYVQGVGEAKAIATLTSPCINLHYDGIFSKQINYFEHIFGGDTATSKLYVQVGSGRHFTTVDSIIDRTQGGSTQPWLERNVWLGDFDENAQVRFLTVRGVGKIDVAIDDINIAIGTPDVGVASIVSPTVFEVGNDGSCLHRGEELRPQVWVKNFGIVPARGGFEMGAILQYGYDQQTISDIFYDANTILAPGDSILYTFSSAFTVPSIDYNNLQVYTNMAMDADPRNDRKAVNVCTRVTGLDDFDDHGGAFLGQNIPNPAANSTKIPYYLPEGGQIRLSIYSIEGQLLYTESTNSDEGEHSIEINTTNFAQGVYTYVLEYKEYHMVKKMVIQK